jgi:hypothetical protein
MKFKSLKRLQLLNLIIHKYYFKNKRQKRQKGRKGRKRRKNEKEEKDPKDKNGE